jgi:hypothetical protein
VETKEISDLREKKKTDVDLLYKKQNWSEKSDEEKQDVPHNLL